VDRIGGERGYCGIGRDPVVSSYGPHLGEEGPIRARFGSGTIFFSGCNMTCRYCQNHDISQGPVGQAFPPDDMARIMLSLQRKGCHNINLVSPTHVMPQVLEALEIAAPMGLEVPIVYNTGGYDSVGSLRLLEGIVDIYMPDMKYSDGKIASRLSGAPDYPEVNRMAVKEMHRQVGDLVIGPDGAAARGLLVRHLVLPNDLAGTKDIMSFISREISARTVVNVMDQYRPSYLSCGDPELGRAITSDEYERAVRYTLSAGLGRAILGART